MGGSSGLLRESKTVDGGEDEIGGLITTPSLPSVADLFFRLETGSTKDFQVLLCGIYFDVFVNILVVNDDNLVTKRSPCDRQQGSVLKPPGEAKTGIPGCQVNWFESCTGPRIGQC